MRSEVSKVSIPRGHLESCTKGWAVTVRGDGSMAEALQVTSTVLGCRMGVWGAGKGEHGSPSLATDSCWLPGQWVRPTSGSRVEADPPDPHAEVKLLQFHEPGVFNYSVLLLSEDGNTLYVGAREAVFALSALNISHKLHEVRVMQPGSAPFWLCLLSPAARGQRLALQQPPSFLPLVHRGPLSS